VEFDRVDQIERDDLQFVPANLSKQCRSLIESYHRIHGYAALPDLLWKSGLGPFIESHQQLRQLLRLASTTRSAKKTNDGFLQIATAILSFEILASSFAGWAGLYPEASHIARTLLTPLAAGQQMPLMAFYLYPPQHMSPSAIATLVPPHPDAADSDRP
jgi:hypothetical protein